MLGELTVVVAAVAKQQQVLQAMTLGVGASVVEHLAKLAICHHIGRARRKFVINLLRLYHQHAHCIEALVKGCHSARFADKLFGGDDYHVGG